MKALPLIRAAAIGSDLPFTGNSSASTMLADATPDVPVRYFRHFVTPDFLATLNIPLRSGRSFTPQDRQGAPLVAVISETGARRLWPGEDAVGKQFRPGGRDAPSVEIVGVAGNARFRSLTSDLTASRAEPDVYFPFAQRTDRDLEIAVRSADGSTVPLPTLQETVASLDPGLPVYSAQRLEDAAAQQTAAARLGSVLLGMFSAGSLLLSAVALYGLVAYVVGLSRREIAIRIALGANGDRVVALIVRNGMMLVGVGLVVGIAGAFLAGRAVETQLFETPKVDPVTYGVVGTLLVLVSLVASFVPARRAVRVDPQLALRAE
ncbi:MAG: ABC transporter permease [Acidobacteria bacterium]|nr:ABC transporter permease [Acidobacteriota bacterium]